MATSLFVNNVNIGFEVVDCPFYCSRDFIKCVPVRSGTLDSEMDRFCGGCNN